MIGYRLCTYGFPLFSSKNKTAVDQGWHLKYTNILPAYTQIPKTGNRINNNLQNMQGVCFWGERKKKGFNNYWVTIKENSISKMITPLIREKNLIKKNMQAFT